MAGRDWLFRLSENGSVGRRSAAELFLSVALAGDFDAYWTVVGTHDFGVDLGGFDFGF